MEAVRSVTEFRKVAGKEKIRNWRDPAQMVEKEIYEWGQGRYLVEFAQPFEDFEGKKRLIQGKHDGKLYPWKAVVFDARSACVYWEKMQKQVESRKQLALEQSKLWVESVRKIDEDTSELELFKLTGVLPNGA